MSMWITPSLPPDELRKRREDSLQKELQWYLKHLQSSLTALKEGLEECVKLLAPVEPGSTLVLSSLRSESVKGFITRIGTKIVKGDLQLRLASVQPNHARTNTNSSPFTRLQVKPSVETPELILPQLLSVRSLINSSLDIIDLSRWTGSVADPSFIRGQLKLLHDYLCDAKAALKGQSAADDSTTVAGLDWTKDSVPEAILGPSIPANLSLHFTIQDANIILAIRSLTPSDPDGNVPADSSFSLSGFGLRSRLLGIGPRAPVHDETGQVFKWHDGQNVVVREKVRVETGDPSLMSVAAKLSALEHEVGRWQHNLNILMGSNDD